MTTEIIEEKEIEIAGEKAIIKLLKINKYSRYNGDVVYFRITGKFKGYEIENVNPVLARLREKYKSVLQVAEKTLTGSPTIEKR